MHLHLAGWSDYCVGQIMQIAYCTAVITGVSIVECVFERDGCVYSCYNMAQMHLRPPPVCRNASWVHFFAPAFLSKLNTVLMLIEQKKFNLQHI